MPTIEDAEFGTVTVRRSAKATQVRLRVAPNGTLRASMPVYAPLFLLKRLLKSSRLELRRLLAEANRSITYQDGQQVGKSHTLVIRHLTTMNEPTVSRKGQQIIARLPVSMSSEDDGAQAAIRKIVIQALRIEAKAYLPKRLDYLARQHDLTYQKVRFSHASSRWGSCSASGTISLNIALMKLPFELIDYVIIHELAHTVELNHSSRFWQLVEQGDPHYKQHRTILKNEAPSV